MIRTTILRRAGRRALLVPLLAAALAAGASAADDFDPPWARVPPLQRILLLYDAALSPQQNGAQLKQRAQALQAGDTLVLGPGTWVVDSFFTLNLQGTAQAPIRVVGLPGAWPTITRSDAGQNALNLGSGAPARFLHLRGLRITGGDTGLRLYDCSDVWIDRCRIRHVAGAGLSANAHGCARLHITRNEISHTGGTAEGMYLGANHGVHVVSESVIAANHVHHTYGSQGDGIELKQGSWGNRIVANVVHDTQYPAILVYGTGGMPPNVVERNVCYRSGDNVVQVQGEAIVRNNLIVAGATGFASSDHQGQSRDLVVVHNTIVNAGRGANLASWGGRPGMVFANNAVYSQHSDSVRFSGGSAGVTTSGNVVLGPVVGAGAGFAQGNGLSDFLALAWDAALLDAHPAPSGALIGAGDAAWTLPADLADRPRTPPVEPGCYDG